MEHGAIEQSRPGIGGQYASRSGNATTSTARYATRVANAFKHATWNAPQPVHVSGDTEFAPTERQHELAAADAAEPYTISGIAPYDCSTQPKQQCCKHEHFPEHHWQATEKHGKG